MSGPGSTRSAGPPLRWAFVSGATPDKWARTWRERSRVPLELVPVEEPEQVAGVMSGEHDAALVRGAVDRDVLHLIALYEEQPVVVAGREHFVAAAGPQDPVDLDDLDAEQLVRPHPSGWRPAAEQLAWPDMTAAEAVETVAAGTGVVILPASVARLHARRDVVVRPVAGLEPSPVGLTWRIDNDDPRVQTLIGVVRGRSPRSSR